MPLLTLASEHAPEDTDLQNNLGAAHLYRGELSEAARRFRIALRLDPENVEARMNLKTIDKLSRPEPPEAGP